VPKCYKKRTLQQAHNYPEEKLSLDSTWLSRDWAAPCRSNSRLSRAGGRSARKQQAAYSRAGFQFQGTAEQRIISTTT
jgi:hypothetical protein